MQNATAMAQLDMAAVDQRTKLAITNANNFLQMDMKNMDTSNENRRMMGKSHNNSEWQIRQQINDNIHKDCKQDYNTYSNHFQGFNQPMINNNLNKMEYHNKLEQLPNPIINNTLLI